MTSGASAGTDFARLPAVPPSRRFGSGRLLGVDATRGLALMGMMAVHVLPLSDAEGTASLAGRVAGGRSAATFAVLAGVGLALATGGRTPPRGRAWAGAAASITVRALLIGVVGLALGTLDSGVAVILPYYAVYFLFAVPLLRLRATALFAVAMVVAVVVPVVSQVVRAGLSPLDPANPTFGVLLHDPVGLLRNLLLTGYYPAFAWTAYLAAGLAAGRLDLRSSRTAWWLLFGGAAVALAAVLVSRLLLGAGGGLGALAVATVRSPAEVAAGLQHGMYGTTPTTSWWWLAVISPHSGTPWDLLHTGGFALALLGALLLLARPLAVVLFPLAAAGGMTLSLYSAHVWLLSTGWLPEDPWVSYLLQVGGALTAATLWRLWVGRGPLEELIALVATPARRVVAGSTAQVRISSG